MLWVQKDLGPAVLALLKNYTDPSKDILGQTFIVASERMTYGHFADLIQEGVSRFQNFPPSASHQCRYIY